MNKTSLNLRVYLALNLFSNLLVVMSVFIRELIY